MAEELSLMEQYVDEEGVFILPDWVAVGRAFRYRAYMSRNNPNNHLFHVRGIVDQHVVVAVWSKYKQRWIYRLIDPIDMRMHELGQGFQVRKSNFDD